MTQVQKVWLELRDFLAPQVQSVHKVVLGREETLVPGDLLALLVLREREA